MQSTKSIQPQCKPPLHTVWSVLRACLLEPNHGSTVYSFGCWGVAAA